MYEINHKTLHELTVEDVETAAQENAQQYEPMFRKAANFGLSVFFQELEELERRSPDIADVMHEADELSNKEDEQ